MHAVLNKIANGITVCYSEVFPNTKDGYLHLTYLGKLFLLADSYCLNPDCTCQEAVLNFVQVYPREGARADNFTIRLKLNGRGYKILDSGRFTRREIKAIILHFYAEAMILKQLNERYRIMREKAKEVLS